MMAYDLTPLYTLNPQKPKYRIQWDYRDSVSEGRPVVRGYWVWSCNLSAIQLKSSFYVRL